MPRYEYKCDGLCKMKFIVRKAITQATRNETCPHCDGPSHRVYSAPSVKVYGGTPTHHGG
jgi:putative FmdB family regulatory protein